MRDECLMRAFEGTCLPGSRDSFHDVAKIAAGFPSAAAERQELRKRCRSQEADPLPRVFSRFLRCYLRVDPVAKRCRLKIHRERRRSGSGTRNTGILHLRETSRVFLAVSLPNIYGKPEYRMRPFRAFGLQRTQYASDLGNWRNRCAVARPKAALLDYLSRY